MGKILAKLPNEARRGEGIKWRELQRRWRKMPPEDDVAAPKALALGVAFNGGWGLGAGAGNYGLEVILATRGGEFMKHKLHKH